LYIYHHPSISASFNACYIFAVVDLHTPSFILHLGSLCKLLPSDSPDGSRRGSVTGNSRSNDLSENTEGRSLLVVMPDLIGDDFDNGHPWVFGSTGVDTISLVTEPCFDGRVVELLDETVVGHNPDRQLVSVRRIKK